MDASVRELDSEKYVFICIHRAESVCVCVYIHVVAGQIHTRTWCCEVVRGYEVRFPTSSQLGPRK